MNSSGLSALRSLDYVQYCGAPLGASIGAQLALYVRLAPSIGSTEAGPYIIELHNSKTDWDYITFQPHAGAEFERWPGNLHELVFVRRPEYAFMQSIFLQYPDKSRFETNDLWIEHPERKGLWKIVGRKDDYVCFAHGEGLHASTLEPEIERHAHVKSALIGGHGRPKPVLLIELISSAQAKVETDPERKTLPRSLEPFLEKVNAQCHPSVQLPPQLVIFANMPFKRTIKDSVARVQTLQLYKDEIESTFAGI